MIALKQKYIRHFFVLISIISITIFLFALSGCATLFGHNNRTLMLHSKPEGANVLLNDFPIGVTPTLININDTFGKNEITLTLKQYHAVQFNVPMHLQKTFFLNIFMPPGIIVDLISGDIYGLDHNTAILNLKPLEKKQSIT